MQHAQAIGLPWFFEDDYEAFRALLPERRWHSSFALWLAAAEDTERKLQAEGRRTFRAQVRSQDFAVWCGSRGLDINNSALVEYANQFAARALLGEHGHH